MSNELEKMPEAIFFMGIDKMFNWLEDQAETNEKNEKDQSNAET